MRWLRRLLVAGVLALIAAAVFVVPMPFMLLMPFEPLSLSGRTTVAADTTPVDGEFLLGAVAVGQTTTAGAISGLARDDVDVALQPQVVPAGVDEELFLTYQQMLFQATVHRAAILALREAGYDVGREDLTGDGALVIQVVPGSPADGHLRPGDVVVEIDGRPIERGPDVREIIREPREVEVEREIRFQRDGRERTATITPQELPIAPEPVLGIQVTTYQPRADLPVDVTVDAGEVGGPSGGLLTALVIYDLVTPDDDVAAGRRIAGTGALGPDGEVIPVQGVRQKVVAAEDADADLFLVPADQADLARDTAERIEVVPVESFRDALERL